METIPSNSAKIQLNSFARNWEWKLRKENEEKQSEYMKLKHLCQTKEKPQPISSLYYSGPLVSSTCNGCSPAINNLFQKSFGLITLKDLLHWRCNSNMKEVKPCKEELQSFHQCSVRGSISYYFMRTASWIMYQVFSYLYKGVLVHPEHIQCIKQAQELGSSVHFFISTPRPDLKTLCSIHFALYYSGLRPPEIGGFENLPWYSRFLFSHMGSLTHGTDSASIITHSVGPYYDDYCNHVIEDIYIVPVAISFDKFVHVNLATPYALSELELKYCNVDLDGIEPDDVRDIDNHIRTDCFQSIPITAACFVAYVLLACRTGNVIQKDHLFEMANQQRGEFIREKVCMNFKGKTEHVVSYGLGLFKSYVKSRISCEGKEEYVLCNIEQLVNCAMGIIVKKLLLCLVTSVVYSMGGVVGIVHGKVVCPAVSLNSEDKRKADLDCEIVLESNVPVTNSKLTFLVEYDDILSKTLELVEKVESNMKIKLFKYCQIREHEINEVVGFLTDCQILNSTNKALLEEEKWCQSLARSLDIEGEEDMVDKRSNRSYSVEALEKSPSARTYINIMSSLNEVFIEEPENVNTV